MPIPKPRSGESEKDFISRCMGDDVMVSEFPDAKQRAAVCYSQWRRKEDESMYGKSGYNRGVSYPDLDEALSPHGYQPKKDLPEDERRRMELDELFPVDDLADDSSLDQEEDGDIE